MRNQFVLGVLLISLLTIERVYGSHDTIGPNGIDSDGLGLTGTGIAIGQIEPSRPGMMGVDAGVLRHSSVNPTAVFRRDGPPSIADTDDHSEQVAGNMISTDAAATGVATGASLYASAYVTPGTTIGYIDAMVTIQHIAQQNGGDVRAINHSWGKALPSGGILDGNSLVTAGLDWSASEFDVLHVVAGNEVSMLPIPTDNFNGVTIAASEKVGSVYRQVAPLNTFNEDALGERTSIDLIAPGVDVRSTLLNDMLTPPVPQVPNDIVDDGTSFAAPHVTGTVALLQEHAENKIGSAPAANWNANARRHEVMKAVQMNSADKLIDNGTVRHPITNNLIPSGRLLGMERTVQKINTDTWFESEAYLEQETFLFDTPLDEEMGTGHLNAKRAL